MWEAQRFSDEEVLSALKFAMGSNAADYRAFHELQNQLSSIIQYVLTEGRWHEA